MMWRARDPSIRPTTPSRDAPYAGVIEELYAGLDAVVGETLDRLGAGRFAGRDVGPRLHFLAPRVPPEQLAPRQRLPGGEEPEPRRRIPGFFGNVDWTRTRAYGLGLQRPLRQPEGREKRRHRRAGRRDALLEEISGSCSRSIDPQTGAPAVTKVYRARQMYTARRAEDIAPDLDRRLRQGHARLGRVRARRRAAGGDRRQRRPLERRSLHGSRSGARSAADQPAAEAAGAGSQTLAAAFLAEFGIDSVSRARRQRKTEHVRIGNQARQGAAGPSQALCRSRRLLVGRRVRHARAREGARQARRAPTPRKRSRRG